MTVRAPGGASNRLEIAQQHAEHVLGERKAKRIAMFDNGTLYVRAGSGATVLAWFIDFIVYLFGFGVAFVALALLHEPMGISDDTVAVVALSSLLVVPLVYGLFYGNGRALGALLAGTQLVRARDGGRVGAKACWAMLVRTLFMPVLLIAVLANSFTTGSAAIPGSARRLSIDPDATRQLHAAGIR